MPHLNHTLYVVSATHWDREWRFPFQETRMMLVNMMDNLLDLLETQPDYACYTLDGQTIPLEDYLEVRPEARERIRRQVVAGRLLIGPWYTLPEENTVSPESLVRNLLWGDRLARQFGEPMHVGYMPTSYGQVSQMPQILAGFGITSAMFYRGINRHVCPKAEYLWEGADRTRLLAFRLGDFARSNFFHLVFRPAVFNRDRSKQVHRWEDGGRVFRIGDGASITPYHVLEAGGSFFPENVAPAIENLEKTDIVGTNTDLALAMQCQDSLEAAAVELDILKKAKEVFGTEKVIHASLPQYVEAVRQRLGQLGVDLQVIRGEMRHTLKEGVWTDLYPHIHAARPDLKLANRRAELALQRWAEPWAAAATTLGVDYPDPFLRLAWRFLLGTHAHDSISGCSMDRVHREGLQRFEQVCILSEGVTRRCLEAVAQHIELPEKGDGSLFSEAPRAAQTQEKGSRPLFARAMYLVVFNPSPHPRSDVVFAEIDVPEEWQQSEVGIADLSGRPVPMQEVSAAPVWAIFQRPIELPLRLRCHRHEVRLLAPDVPGLGYRLFRVVPKKGSGLVSCQVPGEREMENEHLRVWVNEDGTFGVAVKDTDIRFDHLGYFEDDGESGDPWVRLAPDKNDLVTTAGTPARVTTVESGPARTVFRIEREVAVPATSDRAGRSSVTAPLTITTDVILAAGARRVDVETRIVNRARDHRLRAVFPTDLAATVSAAESAYDVVERAIAVPDGVGWKEPPSGAHPMFRFVDVSDGRRGLALIALGVVQYEVLDRPDRAIALTLLRAFQMRNSVRVAEYPDQVDSQLPGEHAFRYALYPHAGDWEAAGLVAEADHHHLPLLSAQMGPGGAKCGEMFGPALSLLTVEPASLVLGAFKKAEEGDGLVVRLANPAPRAVEARVTFLHDLERADLVNLNEDRVLAPATVIGRTARFTIAPKQIATLRVKVK